jgi:hypothetical protein
MPKGNKKNFHERNYFFLEMEMAKKICKLKLQQEMGGPQSQSTHSKGG